MSFDFPDAQPTRARPLEGSGARDDAEADLKRLFLDLFSDMLAADLFDANVLGAAHLGSFETVRKSLGADGLNLLQGDGEEPATRYLYRAWKARNAQGRGLHFLRTYLQMLYPNQSEIEQLWQGKTEPYPTNLKPSLIEGEEGDFYLTSRVRVLLYYGAPAIEISRMADILQAVMPARMVPEFGYLLRGPDAAMHLGVGTEIYEEIDLMPEMEP